MGNRFMGCLERPFVKCLVSLTDCNAKQQLGRGISMCLESAAISGRSRVKHCG